VRRQSRGWACAAFALWVALGAGAGAVPVAKAADAGQGLDLRVARAPQAAQWLACDSETSAIPFRVAAGDGNEKRGGEQPPAAEYLLSLVVAARPVQSRSPGAATITAYVNDYPGASVQTTAESDGPRLRRGWNTIDLVDGTRFGPLPGGISRLSTTNYLPFNSVRPGLNRLWFGVDCYGGGAARFRVEASTRLWETALAPARLELSAATTRLAPEKDRASRVSFLLKNSGDRAAKDVEVRLEAVEGIVEIVGRRLFRFGSLTGATRGTFFVVPRRSGPMRLSLTADSGNSNQPAVMLKGVAVGEQPPDVRIPRWVAVVAFAASLGSIAALVAIRRRRREPAPRGGR